MSPSTDGFRCSAVSREDGEPLAGTAPTEARWLFVEYAGPWGRRAVAESRLPEEVRTHLAALDGVRVQLIRRHGRAERGAGFRVFAADLTDRPQVRSTVLEDWHELIDLEPDGLPAYDGPLWLVCTNGSRDVCCAERGRPVADVVSRRWPEATWETTHLGGHRFAATLLALPSGLVLGGVGADTVLAACEEVETGGVPEALVRGHAGRPGVVQYAEAHARAALGRRDVRAVSSTQDGAVTSVVVVVGDQRWSVEVESGPGPPRRASCADLDPKPTTAFRILSMGRAKPAAYS